MFTPGRYNDHIDEKKLIARPLVDNVKEDKYLYEIITFTGPWNQSSCDSAVQLILTGSEDKTEVRTLDPGWKDTLRKGCADSYVMKTPRWEKVSLALTTNLLTKSNLRPLGDLQYMRIWHDSSGRGHYASWYITALVVRDIQTNERFEFLCNRWLAVEKDDGHVRRSSWAIVFSYVINNHLLT